MFNTPNDQSRPGYLKMGWREVGRLPAAVRVSSVASAPRTARARVPAELWSRPLTVGIAADDWFGDPQGPALPDVHLPSPAATRYLRTERTSSFLRWRYCQGPLEYRVLPHELGCVVVRARKRGAATELVVASALGLDASTADGVVKRALAEASADHAIRLGASSLRHGWVPLPGGGPLLTWRAVSDDAMPPLANWNLELGDIELF